MSVLGDDHALITDALLDEIAEKVYPQTSIRPTDTIDSARALGNFKSNFGLFYEKLKHNSAYDANVFLRHMATQKLVLIDDVYPPPHNKDTEEILRQNLVYLWILYEELNASQQSPDPDDSKYTHGHRIALEIAKHLATFVHFPKFLFKSTQQPTQPPPSPQPPTQLQPQPQQQPPPPPSDTALLTQTSSARLRALYNHATHAAWSAVCVGFYTQSLKFQNQDWRRNINTMLLLGTAGRTMLHPGQSVSPDRLDRNTEAMYLTLVQICGFFIDVCSMFSRLDRDWNYTPPHAHSRPRYLAEWAQSRFSARFDESATEWDGDYFNEEWDLLSRQSRIAYVYYLQVVLAIVLRLVNHWNATPDIPTRMMQYAVDRAGKFTFGAVAGMGLLLECLVPNSAAYMGASNYHSALSMIQYVPFKFPQASAKEGVLKLAIAQFVVGLGPLAIEYWNIPGQEPIDGARTPHGDLQRYPRYSAAYGNMADLEPHFVQEVGDVIQKLFLLHVDSHRSIMLTVKKTMSLGDPYGTAVTDTHEAWQQELLSHTPEHGSHEWETLPDRALQWVTKNVLGGVLLDPSSVIKNIRAALENKQTRKHLFAKTFHERMDNDTRFANIALHHLESVTPTLLAFLHYAKEGARLPTDVVVGRVCMGEHLGIPAGEYLRLVDAFDNRMVQSLRHVLAEQTDHAHRVYSLSHLVAYVEGPIKHCRAGFMTQPDNGSVRLAAKSSRYFQTVRHGGLDVGVMTDRGRDLLDDIYLATGHRDRHFVEKKGSQNHSGKSETDNSQNASDASDDDDDDADADADASATPDERAQTHTGGMFINDYQSRQHGIVPTARANFNRCGNLKVSSESIARAARERKAQSELAQRIPNKVGSARYYSPPMKSWWNPAPYIINTDRWVRPDPLV